MRKLHDISKSIGEVELLIVRNGKIVDARTIRNMVLDTGNTFYARSIGDDSFTASIRHIVLGKGTTSPAMTDTNLQTAFTNVTDINDVTKAIKDVVKGPVTLNTAKFVATFPAGASELISVGSVISEAILVYDTSDRAYASGSGIAYTSDGGAHARIAFDPISKSSAEALILTWRCSIT